MDLREALRASWLALASNRVRTLLTALGLIFGNASVIWVVTISQSSRDLILDQIRSLGSNIVYGYYETGELTAMNVAADYVKMADVEEIRRQLTGRIAAATGVMTIFDRMVINGRERDIKVIGSDEHYAPVRNLLCLAGRFLDSNDVATRLKAALLTDKLAVRIYGSRAAAVGRRLKIHGLEFTVIGVFKEKGNSFGFSEVAEETILIPITVIRYFINVERVDPFYVQARTFEDVRPVTRIVRTIIESRHRPGAKYLVENLAGLLDTAATIARILTLVLVLVAAIALLISGIGIMNIMLVTVTERTREIGVRMAVGASRTAVMAQFLTEAVLISLAGGLVGIALGVAAPMSVRFFLDDLVIPVSWVAVGFAFLVSFAEGLAFGILPAHRASRLNPTEALRYE